jgi:hypothetical protein
MHVIGLLTTTQTRHDEDDLDALAGQRGGQTFAGRAETTGNMRGKLPTEHQDTHQELSMPA